MAAAPRGHACLTRVVLVVAVVFLAIAGSCHAGERRLSSILASFEKPVSRPQVIVLYNSQSTADKDILVLVKRTAKQVPSVPQHGVQCRRRSPRVCRPAGTSSRVMWIAEQTGLWQNRYDASVVAHAYFARVVPTWFAVAAAGRQNELMGTPAIFARAVGEAVGAFTSACKVLPQVTWPRLTLCGM